MDRYLSGDALWGDDLAPAAVAAWFAAEAAVAAPMPPVAGAYAWREQQSRHVWRWLPPRRWRHVLGFGSAHGAELVPLAAERATIVEPLPAHQPDPALTFPVTYLRARETGDIALDDGTVDLVVSFGVLHHVANVTHVLAEFARVGGPGAYLCLGEPITSLGDWRRPRPGCTPNERGLPRRWLHAALAATGWDVQVSTLAELSLIAKLWPAERSPWNSRAMVRADAALCSLLRSRVRYHATNRIQKVRPTAEYVVARLR